jgi:hypothetical protein
MTLVQAKLQDETVLMDLRRSSIAVWDVGTVADLSQLLNTAYEGRTQMDITLGVASNLGADLGEIESVTISGEIDEETDEIDVGPVES